MEKRSLGESLGLLAPLTAAALYLFFASDTLGSAFAERPTILAALTILWLALLARFFSFPGLLLGSATTTLAAWLVYPDHPLHAAILYPALAGWAAAAVLALRKSGVARALRRSHHIADELRSLRERVALLETLPEAGGMADILAAASHAWRGEVQALVDTAAATLPAISDSRARKEHIQAFEHALAALREHLADQAALAGEASVTLDHEYALEDVVARALELIGDALALQGVVVEKELDNSGGPFVIDREMAALALAKLVENAADASGRGGKIVIVAETDFRGEKALIEVVDRGGGIRSDTIEHIFKPFFSTRPGRMGMGLSIAREIVAKLGGSISVSANETRGMTFRIRLPMRRALPRSGEAREGDTSRNMTQEAGAGP